ncbi:hypothetical protein AQJ27_43605 [Streptomyces olivochromogenes]|nr:hypothetical protein AQJ27_43605 [Streptomyces olivochromogenes]
MTQRPPQVWAGIDVGKGHHWITVVDSDGDPLWNRKVINSESDILAAFGEAVGMSDHVTWALDLIDGPASLLLEVLATELESVMSVAGIRRSPLAIGAPLVSSWCRLDDFAGPGQSDLFQAPAVLGDPVLLGSGSQGCCKAVRVADLDRQPAVFVHVDVEAQAAVSADADRLAWSQVGQLLFPGVQVMLEEVKVKPGVEETCGDEHVCVQNVVAGQHAWLGPSCDAHDTAGSIRIGEVDQIHRSGLRH